MKTDSLQPTQLRLTAKMKTKVYILPTFKTTEPNYCRFSRKDKTVVYRDDTGIIFTRKGNKLTKIGEIVNDANVKEIIFSNSSIEYECKKHIIRDYNNVLQDSYHLVNPKKHGFNSKKLVVDYIYM